MARTVDADPPVVQELDLKGLKCPLPALKARKALAELCMGSMLRVSTTDPLAGLDIPHMCHEAGHTLMSQSRTDDGHVFVIQRGDRFERAQDVTTGGAEAIDP